MSTSMGEMSGVVSPLLALIPPDMVLTPGERSKWKRFVGGRIARGRESTFSETVRVTPELALYLLEVHNRHNRNLRRHVAERYARTMEDGDWLLTCNGIGMSRSGFITNGQHRLAGVVVSGETVDFLFLWGEADKAYFVHDIPLTRTGADALGIRGEERPALLAAAVKAYLTAISSQPRSGSKRNNKIPHETLADTVDTHPDLRLCTQPGTRFNRAIPRTSAAGASAAWYLIHSRSPSAGRLDEFWERMCLPDNTPANDARMRLREGIARDRIPIVSSSSNSYTAAVIVNTWNQWLRARLSGKLSWPNSEPFPEVK